MIVHRDPGVRPRRHEESDSTRTSLIHRHNDPFLVVMVLPVWEDTPWFSTTRHRHRNMGALIQIIPGHVRVVPTHKQTDGGTSSLPPPAKWPVELTLISNK